MLKESQYAGTDCIPIYVVAVTDENAGPMFDINIKTYFEIILFTLHHI